MPGWIAGMQANKYTHYMLQGKNAFSKKGCLPPGWLQLLLLLRTFYDFQGGMGMHWPVVCAPGSLALRIAKQEMARRELAEAAE